MSTVLVIVLYILIGASAGFMAGKLMKGGGFGFIVNVIVGIIGGFLGEWLCSLFGIDITEVSLEALLFR